MEIALVPCQMSGLDIVVNSCWLARGTVKLSLTFAFLPFSRVYENVSHAHDRRGIGS